MQIYFLEEGAGVSWVSMSDKPKDEQETSGANSPPDRPLTDAHLDGLGEALRQQYEKVKDEPVPDSMKALLQRLRAIEAGEDE